MPMRNAVTASTFTDLGNEMLHRHFDAFSDQNFREMFGIGPAVSCTLWKKCYYPARLQPKYLLWALLFLKMYATEATLSSIAHTNCKTVRKWRWLIVGAIAAQKPQMVSLFLQTDIADNFVSLLFFLLDLLEQQAPIQC